MEEQRGLRDFEVGENYKSMSRRHELEVSWFSGKEKYVVIYWKNEWRGKHSMPSN